MVITDFEAAVASLEVCIEATTPKVCEVCKEASTEASTEAGAGANSTPHVWVVPLAKDFAHPRREDFAHPQEDFAHPLIEDEGGEEDGEEWRRSWNMPSRKL